MTSPAVAATGKHDEIRGGDCSLPERAFPPGRDCRVMHGRLDRRSARGCPRCRGAAGQRFRSVFPSVESKVSAGQRGDAEGQQSHERNRSARNGVRGVAKCLRADRSLQHGGSRQYRPRHPGGHPVFRLGVALRAGRTSNFFGNTEIFWKPPCDSGGQCSIRDFANHSLSPNLSEMCQPQWLNGNIKLRRPTTLAPPATAQARPGGSNRQISSRRQWSTRRESILLYRSRRGAVKAGVRSRGARRSLTGPTPLPSK